MYDVGDLPVLTFGCVLKPGVIKWPVKLYVRFLRFLTFFQNPENDFLLFLSCYARFLEHCLGAYDDHLRLIGKRVVDFLLLLTELFY